MSAAVISRVVDEWNENKDLKIDGFKNLSEEIDNYFFTYRVDDWSNKEVDDLMKSYKDRKILAGAIVDTLEEKYQEKYNIGFDERTKSLITNDLMKDGNEFVKDIDKINSLSLSSKLENGLEKKDEKKPEKKIKV